MNAKGSDVRGNPHMVRKQFLSYKDIHGVMRASADLVRPVHHLHHVLNYKGT